MSDAIALISGAERMLAEAKTVMDFKDVRDMGRMASHYARLAGLGKAAVNEAKGVVFKAEVGLANAVDREQAAGTIATPGGDHGRSNVTTCYIAPPAPMTLEEAGIQRMDLHRARELRDAATTDAIDAAVEHATDEGRIITRADITRPQITTNSGRFECYTPPEFTDAARTVMGGIDLDPASSEIANRTVQASMFYTQEDNGLTRDWSGRVWLNPPFARGLIGKFIDKLCESPNITQAIVLTNNATETVWGQRLLTNAAAVCFPAGRINFHDHNGRPREDSGALQGQMIAYLGTAQDAERFTSVFNRFGVVL